MEHEPAAENWAQAADQVRAGQRSRVASQARIEKLVSATGLPVYITQYDIGLADDELQKQQYQDHLTMFWQNPSVKGVTILGYVAGYTWRSNTGSMKSDGTKRPAMAWLMEFLGR